MFLQKFISIVAFLVFAVEVNSESLALYNFPQCSDLDSYLNVIEKAINFTGSIDVDASIGFSLLVIKANFIHAGKALNTSEHPEEKIRRIGLSIDRIMLSEDFPLTGPWRGDLGIVPFFNLSSAPKLNAAPIKKVEETYHSIKEYIDDLTNLDLTVRLSMICLDDFENLLRSNGTVKCQITDECLFLLRHGSNYGYGITHRLAIMILANSRGCYVFTPEEDRELKHSFCSAMYNEALYLVKHNYTSLDLLMEEVCLCSSLGYVQFLSRAWFAKVLSYQSNYGCFEVDQFADISTRQMDIDILCAKNETYAKFLKSRNCDIHLTSIAAAAIASGARYIIQKCSNVLTNTIDGETKYLLTDTNIK